MGGGNATWPFATLTAKPNELILKVTFFGTYTFPSRHVLKIEKYVLIPFMGWGVKIEHDISSYPQKIIFWYLGYPKTVLAYIAASGFTGKPEA